MTGRNRNGRNLCSTQLEVNQQSFLSLQSIGGSKHTEMHTATAIGKIFQNGFWCFKSHSESLFSPIETSTTYTSVSRKTAEHLCPEPFCHRVNSLLRSYSNGRTEDDQITLWTHFLRRSGQNMQQLFLWSFTRWKLAPNHLQVLQHTALEVVESTPEQLKVVRCCEVIGLSLPIL